GNAESEQSARAMRALEDSYPVPGLVELRGGRETGRSGTDHSDMLARAALRRIRFDPAFVPRAVDDADFDLLDRNRLFINAENTGRFAGRGANLAGKFRKVVRLVQRLDRLAPM